MPVTPGQVQRTVGKSVVGSFSVADLPAAASNTGKVHYVTDGAAGAPCLAVSDGTDWKRVTLGAAVAAS